MQKIYKEYCKAQSGCEADFEPLDELLSPPNTLNQSTNRKDRDLSLAEKKYLLATERGDIVTVKKYTFKLMVGYRETMQANAISSFWYSKVLLFEYF